MKKRLLALLLVGAMCVGMTACGGGEDTPEATPTPVADVKDNTDATPTPDPNDPYTIKTDANGNKIDLGGAKIIIGDWWSTGEETEATSAYDEAREEWLDWCQKTYNFTIEQQNLFGWSEMADWMITYSTTGSDDYYLVYQETNASVASMAKNGLLYDLSTLDCLDFTEEKWGTKVHEQMTYGDAIYAMNAGDTEPRSGIYFNKRLLEDAGINPQTIYDLQESGEWTWDKFEEICAAVQADTDNDGVIDRWAMTNHMDMFYYAAVWSNGGEFVGKNADGEYTLEVFSDATMEALNWALEMRDTYNKVFDADAAWDYTFTAFKNSEAVFTCHDVYKTQDWYDMPDEYGFVCFPKGPRMDDYTNVYTNHSLVIPACYDEEKAWAIAFAYDLYTDPVPGYEDYAGWKAGYYNRFRDTDSVDLSIARMMTNGTTKLHLFIPDLKVPDQYFWGISKDDTPAQRAESLRDTWQSYIDAANGK